MAVANGSAPITTTAGAASGSATVTVAQEVSAAMLAPEASSRLSAGVVVGPGTKDKELSP